MKRLLYCIVLIIINSVAYASDKLSAITTQGELGYFVQTYYLEPKPELVESAIEYVSSSGLSNNPNAVAPLLMSFSCIFSKYDNSKKNEWKNIISGIEGSAKKLFNRSINELPSAILDSTPVSPAKNDMNWACFFATGEYKYLNEIISTLKHFDERRDIELFLAAASAKWSLSSNSIGHIKVRMAMEAVKVGDVIQLRKIAEEIISKKPSQIRKETIAILKAQKEKGIW